MGARSLRWIIIPAVVFALVFGLVGSVAATPADNPGKGPPAIDKIVFVHYPKDTDAGRPDWLPAPGGKGKKDECPFKYRRISWDDSTITSGGVPYEVNLGGRDATFLGGIQAAFNAWENDPCSYMDFDYIGLTEVGISSLNDERDGYNVVGWSDLRGTKYDGAIAICITWYFTNTKQIIEVDTAMNSDPFFEWWQNDPGEDWTAGGVKGGIYDVDVQNIMTHEVGHWLKLLDLYDEDEATMAQTMYGRSAERDLTKRSLACGDEAGIRKIYEGPSSVETCP